MRVFPANSRVCFIGDSITHNNGFVSYIAAFYHEHYKERKVSFYNCGVSGGQIRTALPIFDRDVLAYKPTHAVVMFGMNDSCSKLLEFPRNMERYAKLVSAYESYKQNLAELCRRLSENKVEIILCTPTPYDEYQDIDTPALRGGYALLAGYAQYVRQYAVDNNYDICDFFNFFSREIHRESLIRADRVHPNEKGQFMLAKCFLDFQGLNLGTYKPLPQYMEKWRENVLAYRNLWAAERLIIDRYDLAENEQISIIEEYLKENANNKEKQYVVNLAIDYIKNKQRQNEINQAIISQMEVEFKKQGS